MLFFLPQIDVRSENAKKFRDLFDKGEVPEGGGGVSGKILQEKEQELENMRKARKEKKDFFNKLEAGEIGVDSQDKKEPKLLVGRISKEVSLFCKLD